MIVRRGSPIGPCNHRALRHIHDLWELERHVNRLAHGIDDRLPTGSGHVAIMLENGIPYLAMSYAMKKLGRIEVSINRALGGGTGAYGQSHRM